MTNIVVSYRDGVVTAPNGEKFRVVRGKTLADARHPAVQMRPESWGPMVVELSVDDPDESGEPDTRMAELTEALGAAQSEADGYREQLAAVTEVLSARGLMPNQPLMEGWLAKAVAVAIDAPAAAPPEPVKPPRAARSRKPVETAAVPILDDGVPGDDDDDLA